MIDKPKYKTYVIRVPIDLWSSFKATISKNENINNIIIEEIKRRVDNFKKWILKKFFYLLTN